MATGTYAPWYLEQLFDDNGNPLNGGTIETFVAGTSTHVAVFSDVNLTTAYSNPLTLNSAGRLPSNGSMFLTPGVSYKFLIKNSAGTTIATPDNISAIPGSSAGVDVIGTFGEAITAGQAVYLSDGSGGKTAGLWYKADSANAYSSTTPEVGIAPNSASTLGSGTIRIDGTVSGLTSLTVGAIYYTGTSGAITATAPANRRIIGQADSTSTLVIGPIPPVVTVDTGVCDGRLTLTTAVPVTTADVTAATTLFFTPYGGGLIALYDGTNWNLRTLTEISVAVPATTATMYDVWVFDNSGTPALELLAWTNDTTRATALTTQNGVLVKTGAVTRRYVGSFRTTGVSGQTEDSLAKRYVWNFYNRVTRALVRKESTASWAYTTATIRQANGAAANQVEVVIGLAEVFVDLGVTHFFQPNTGTTASAGIGYDTTSAFTGGAGSTTTSPSNADNQLQARLLHAPAIGRHFYSWNEFSEATAGTTTWFGTNPTVGATGMSSGLSGWLLG